MFNCLSRNASILASTKSLSFKLVTEILRANAKIVPVDLAKVLIRQNILGTYDLLFFFDKFVWAYTVSGDFFTVISILTLELEIPSF